MEVLGTSLLNELDRIKQPFILVLDDYHLVKEIDIHNLISQLLNHPPQFFHLVIIGRRDPPLPISSLRAQSQINRDPSQRSVLLSGGNGDVTKSPSGNSGRCVHSHRFGKKN